MNEESTKKYVWVIEEGWYEDYRVVGVFSTQEKAQIAYAALEGTREYGITLHDEPSRWALDPAPSEL
jgi:hypothetical protein